MECAVGAGTHLLVKIVISHPVAVTSEVYFLFIPGRIEIISLIFTRQHGGRLDLQGRSA